jgi:hypothetical protein
MKTKIILFKVIFTLAACSLYAEDINSLLWQGKPEEAKEMILADPNLILGGGEHGFTPAHIAAWKGNNDFLTFVIEKGADIKHQDKYLRPVISKAIMGNHPETVAFLLKRALTLIGWMKMVRLH